MPDTVLDTTRSVDSVCVIWLGADVLLLFVPGVAVGVIIHRRCLAPRVEVTHSAISATREFFSEDEGVEFLAWIVDVTELPLDRNLSRQLVRKRVS